jgi:ABC-type polysaccharide/polyol phosphate export systems, permease component
MVTTLVASRVLRRTTALSRTLSRAGSVTARDLTAARHASYWMVVLSGFFEPVLYLFSIGVGVGALVGEFRLADGGVISYAAFVAPAMLAASAMNAALSETGFNFFARLKWVKLYDAMVATPLRPFEVALGELLWAMARGLIYSVVFLGIMIALDLTTVWRAVPALAASLLVGLAFGGLGMAISTFMRSWQDFDYLSVATFALFLFSGTFTPADSYPEALRVIVALTPLYHGVELVRGFTTGMLSLAMVGHALYLAALAAVALAVAGRRMNRLLCR